MKTDSQWLEDVVAMFRKENMEDFIAAKTGARTMDEILRGYRIAENVWPQPCPICGSDDGEVCAEGFESDVTWVMDEIGCADDVSEVQVARFMDAVGLNSSRRPIYEIAAIIDALNDDWKEMIKEVPF